MKKLALAAVCTLAVVGFVMADEFTASVTKIDGKNITYFKTKAPEGGAKKGGGKKGGGGFKMEKTGDAVTTAVSASVKVQKKAFDMEKGEMVVSDVKEGLAADNFKMIDADVGVNVTITVADDGADKGKITSIILGGKGGGKKGGGKKGG
jgi:hypothetical protein